MKVTYSVTAPDGEVYDFEEKDKDTALAMLKHSLLDYAKIEHTPENMDEIWKKKKKSDKIEQARYKRYAYATITIFAEQVNNDTII